MLIPLVLALLLAVQAPPLERAIWGLIVNDVEMADSVEVVVRDDGPWIPVAAIDRLELKAPMAGRRETLYGTLYVSLRSLAPDIQFSLDEATIQLRLVVATRLLPRTDLLLSNPRPPGLTIARTRSLFFNYFGSWSSQGGSDLFGEINANAGRLALFSGVQVNQDGQTRRGLTTVTFDQPNQRRRWSFGDQIGRASALGSSPLVAGISVAREGALDPYAVSYSTPTISGSTFQPSRAQLFVGGQLVSEMQIPSGDFSLNRLPVSSGLGSAQVVLTDAAGRQQQLGITFYLSTDVLRRGEQDYHYLAGAERESTLSSTTYGRTLGTAKHRVGVTDALTLGFQAEGSEAVASAGPTLDLRLWSAGTIGLAMAASRSDSSSGESASMSYEFVARRFSAFARATWIGGGYANLYLPPRQSPTLYVNGALSTPLTNRVTVALGWRTLNALEFIPETVTPGVSRLGIVARVPSSTLEQGFGDLQHEVQVGGSFRLTRRINIRGVATQIREPDRNQWEGIASLEVAVGRREALSAYGGARGGVDAAGVELNRGLSLGPSVGYRVSATQEADATTVRASLIARSSMGQAEASMSRDIDGSITGTATLSGSVVAMQGKVGFVPVIDDGFALVRVPGVPRVRVYANHQEIGRTDRSGSLFVSNLQSYMANTISIEPEDVPFEMSLGLTDRLVAPASRGGATALFEAKRVTAVMGSIRIRKDGTERTPAYGTLIVAGVDGAVSPLNADGEFYIEGLGSGTYDATVEYQDDRCVLTLEVPSSSDLMFNLGRLICLAAQ